MPYTSGTLLGKGDTAHAERLLGGQKDPLEEGIATHSSILAWRIQWTEEPGGLQSIGPVVKSWTRLKRLVHVQLLNMASFAQKYE